jgi:hypothetical protein
MPERGRGPGRAVVPAVYGLAVGSWWLYNHASAAVANRVIFVYAACLLAGPGIVYAVLRRADASSRRSALWALGVPMLWLAKEIHRVSAVHPFLESLYYGLNPFSLGVFCAAAVPTALIEIGLRRRRAGAWRLGGWPGVTLAIFVLLAAAAAAVGHGSGGREIFYAYVRLHRFLFAGSP